MRRVEVKAQGMEAPVQSIAFFQWKQLNILKLKLLYIEYIYRIYIYIESFKLLLNEIKSNRKQNSFIIIRKDALLSKGASNKEMASQDLHLHLCNTDSENTSLLVNNSNISLLSPPSPLTFAGGFAASFSLLRVFECRTLQLR